MALNFRTDRGISRELAIDSFTPWWPQESVWNSIHPGFSQFSCLTQQPALQVLSRCQENSVTTPIARIDLVPAPVTIRCVPEDQTWWLSVKLTVVWALTFVFDRYSIRFCLTAGHASPMGIDQACTRQCTQKLLRDLVVVVNFETKFKPVLNPMATLPKS